MSGSFKPSESYAIKLAQTGSLTDASINLITGEKIVRIRALREELKIPVVNNWSLRKPLSETHSKIGMRLAYVRLLNDGPDELEFTARLGWTMSKYLKVESGVYPLELLDIINLARVLECTPSDVITLNFGE